MIRKWCNLMLTFLVSGIWHGGTLKFIFWGLMHSIYQIIGELTFHIRDRIWQVSGVRSLRLKQAFRITGTSFLFMISMIIFRADTLTIGLWMIRSMFVDFNPWVLSGRYMYNLGLSQNEWSVLLCSVFILFAVSLCHEKNIFVGEHLMKMNVVFRYAIYLCSILIVTIYGSYGFGFNASDFIYRGF